MRFSAGSTAVFIRWSSSSVMNGCDIPIPEGVRIRIRLLGPYAVLKRESPHQVKQTLEALDVKPSDDHIQRLDSADSAGNRKIKKPDFAEATPHKETDRVQDPTSTTFPGSRPRSS